MVVIKGEDITRSQEIQVQNEIIAALRNFQENPWNPAIVMDLDNYKRVRRILTRDDGDSSKWEPRPNDMIMGYLVVVDDKADPKEPHVEMRPIPRRDVHFAGQTRMKNDEEEKK